METALLLACASLQQEAAFHIPFSLMVEIVASPSCDSLLVLLRRGKTETGGRGVCCTWEGTWEYEGGVRLGLRLQLRLGEETVVCFGL